MNPFDLRGPEFLLFYSVLGIGVLAVIAWRRWFFEPHPPIEVRLTDPFLIAYLRAGPMEVLRVTTLSLVERGLLKASGTVLETKEPAHHPKLSELEQLLLKRFDGGGLAAGMFSDGALERACDEMRESLASMGLVPDARQRQLRWWSSLIGLAVLAVVAFSKIGVALERGKSNIGFLVLLAAAFALGALQLARRPQRTSRGTAALQDLQHLLRPAKERISRSASPTELALVAATFGAVAFPDGAARLKQIFPKASPSTSGCGSGCGTTWASGCGSSAGSSGGSSCGGGGCGGGCGGCGGD